MKTKAAGLDRFNDFTEKGKIKIGEICHMAARVFSEKGYQTATLDDVAQAAGISKGCIYHYFSAKEELLCIILIRYMDRSIYSLQNVLKKGSNPKEKIRLFIDHHINHFCNTPHESRLIMHEALGLPESYFSIVRHKELEYVDILLNTINDLLIETNTPDAKAKIITYSLLGMCNWIYLWYDPNGEVRPDQLADQIYKIFIGEMLAR